MNDELLDELYETLTRVCHYYEGMKQDIENGKYAGEQAQRDWETLACTEGMSVMPIIAEMALAHKWDLEDSLETGVDK